MTTTTSSPAFPTLLPRPARRVLELLNHLQHGSLDVQAPDGEMLHFGNQQQPRAALRIADWQVCAAALQSGDVGFAESFVAGHWSSPDLRALLELLIRNRTALESLVYGGFWGGLLHRLRHLLNRNTRAGSRKNIHAHYDLGNAFYKLWLDPTMNYSSAWFGGVPERSLPAAQQAKMNRALSEAGVTVGSRVLEIGCGWGAVAEVAARDFDAQLTGVTLSTEQLAWAQQRLQAAGLSADLRLQDYRDIADEPFDAIVSIEMFEAVGREYWDGYFRTVRDKLKPGGRACIQSITIRDDLFDRYVRSTDFIQQYIFPGGLLPSPSQFRAHAAKAGLRVLNELAFGADYAETLRRWREDFLRHEGPVRELGFDTRFLRLWEFYLAYCEAAFAAGNTDVMQFTLVRD
ncbi:MAG TPA: cyclopropane-fatty-acyl-phospholipid synthase family protein [Roseateles sp.]